MDFTLPCREPAILFMEIHVVQSIEQTVMLMKNKRSRCLQFILFVAYYQLYLYFIHNGICFSYVQESKMIIMVQNDGIYNILHIGYRS